MGNRNWGFSRDDTRFIVDSKTRQMIASSLVCVTSMTLVSVGVKDGREVEDVCDETILLSCGYHQLCLICKVGGNMPYNKSHTKDTTSHTTVTAGSRNWGSFPLSNGILGV